MTSTDSLSTPPIMNTSWLNERIHPAYDYTNHDVIVESLLDIVKCPIAIEVSDLMILFNDQCYDVLQFDQYKADEYTRNQIRTSSGYPSRFKDPRTGEDFNFRIAINTLLHSELPILGFEEMLLRRVQSLSRDEARVYLPPDKDVIHVGEFVTHITRLGEERIEQRSLYNEMINSRMRAGNDDLLVQNVIPRQLVAHSNAPPALPVT